MTDEELIRMTLSDRAATPREKDLAKRMLRLLHTLDDYEELLFEEMFLERGVMQ